MGPFLIATTEIAVRSASGDYFVHVGEGVRHALPRMVADVSPSGRCALISDDTVAELWADPVAESLEEAGLDATVATFPAGEASKTRETWAALTDALLAAGLGRDCCVAALGGGVAGDVAGFVAATYMRGVPFVQIPTTTLAMIDASVGGKTGVDHPSGKNLVGAFHAPSAVLADPAFLQTLQRARRAEGYAEAVKHGVVADGAYAEWLVARAEPLLAGRARDVERAVHRSVEIKAAVVSEDEFDGGRRQVLNFGHTVGHALESVSGYALPHGHAVAAGMVAEAWIGEALGVTAAGAAATVRRLVRAFGLPAGDPRLRDPERLVERMKWDKKTAGGVVHMALLEDVGRASAEGGWARPVPSTELVGALKRLAPGLRS